MSTSRSYVSLGWCLLLSYLEFLYYFRSDPTEYSVSWYDIFNLLSWYDMFSEKLAILTQKLFIHFSFYFIFDVHELFFGNFICQILNAVEFGKKSHTGTDHFFQGQLCLFIIFPPFFSIQYKYTGQKSI